MNADKLPTSVYVVTAVVVGITALVTFLFILQLLTNGRVSAVFSDNDYKCGAVSLMAQNAQVPIVTSLYTDATTASTMIGNCNYRPPSFQYGTQTCTLDSSTNQYTCK